MNDQNKSRQQLLVELIELREAYGELASKLARHAEVEEALRKGQLLQRAILDNIPDPAWAKSLEGRFEAVNEAWCVFTGLARDEAVGKSDAELFPPATAAQFREEERRVAETGQPSRAEESMSDRQGSLRTFETYKIPLIDSTGRVTGTIGIARDITERKLAQTALAQAHAELEKQVADRTSELTHANERLQQLLNALPIGVVVAEDASCRVIHANPAAARMFETATETNVSSSAATSLSNRFFHQGCELKPEEQPVQMAVFGNREVPPMEIEARLASGRCWTSLISATPLHDREGRVVGGVGAILDITQQKQAEERLRLAIDGAHLGIWHWDVRTGSLDFSDTSLALFGLPPGTEMTYGKWEAAVHPEDIDAVNRAKRRSLHDLSDYREEYRVLWPDGSEHWIRTLGRVYCGPDGSPARMVGVLLDITERKRAELELHRARSLLDEGQRIAHLGSWEFVVATQETIWSDEEKRIFGLAPHQPSPNYEEMLRRHIHPADAAELDRISRNAIQHGKTFESENRIVWPDGTVRFVHNRAQPYFDENGKLMRFMGVTLDITERRVMEEQLRQWNTELERKVAERTAELVAANSAKSEFLASMSHEIRTPMNGVLGMTGLLLDTELTLEQRRFAETIRASGEAMLTLINDILDISRIEAGKLRLETLDFDLRSLLDEFAAPLAATARAKGLEFTWSAAPEVPARVCGDAGRLRQILGNLVGNAIKFTDRGLISVQVSLSAETDDDALVRFTVRDTGIGIPAEKQGRLFERFSQVDNSSTRRFGGTGLGLAIAKELTELMGGEIGMTSQAGVGSEFWCTVRLRRMTRKFPVNKAAADAGRPIRPELPKLRRTRARVLVAEDNVVNQEVALGILRKLGFQAEAVADGLEAIESLTTLPYDLVLMDMQMPEMDGLEATRVIRDPNSAVLNHLIPVIAMTANAMPGDREICLAAGMNDYVSKPVSPQTLIEALNNWLPPERPEP